eukprot:gene20487-22503_t
MSEEEVEEQASRLEKVISLKEDTCNAVLVKNGDTLSNAIESLPHLKDTKLKRKSLKLLEQRLKENESETRFILIKMIRNRGHDHERVILLKTVLYLLDGSPFIRKTLITEAQEICTLVTESLGKACSSIESRGSLQDESFSNDIQDSELFNALKICISILQYFGTNLIEALSGCYATNQSYWGGKWLEELISNLLTILQCKMLIKELTCLAGIAMAHVVNILPSLDWSMRLTKWIICITENRNDAIAVVDIGPLRIETRSCGAKDFSVLSRIMVFNGLLSVCNPEILLSNITLDERDERLLIIAFSTICEACLKCLHASIKYHSFQGPHASIDGIPKLTHCIFRRLLELHSSEAAVLLNAGKEVERNELFLMIAEKLLRDPWYMKGRYSLLCELLLHFDGCKISELRPSLATELCKCFGTSTLPSIANECYRCILLNASKSDSPMTSPPMKFWTAERWASVWVGLLLSLLKNENVRFVHNAVLYFIPTTLQLVDGAFGEMIKAISKELFAGNDLLLTQSKSAAMRIRSQLLFGYCSVFKLGRKTGLACFSDINRGLLKESLLHISDDVRAAAISVLCHNNKTTEPISDLEETLVLEFLAVNLNCASSSFRQSLFVSLKAFLARARDSSIMMHRNYTKELKRVEQSSTEGIPLPERLQASIDLVETIVSLSLRNLFPGASFQRRRTGLQIFYSVLEIFSSPDNAVKKGKTIESLKSFTDWIAMNKKWNFINLQNLKIIMSCLEDQHDEIRELALAIITNWFQFETMDIDNNDKETFFQELWTRAKSLMSSPKIRDVESGAILTEFIAKRFAKMDEFVLNADHRTLVEVISSWGSVSIVNITQFVMYLVERLEDDVIASESDFLYAAVHRPAFGHALAAKRCFNALVQRIRSRPSSSIAISNEVVDTLAVLVEKIVHTCSLTIKTALSVFSKSKEDLQGASPSFADINESLDTTLLSCKSFKNLKISIGSQHCLELLYSFCWLNIKAASLFLGDVAKFWTLDALNVSQKKAVLSDTVVQTVGKIFKETLINCRHKGVIVNSCTGFQMFCKSLSSPPSPHVISLLNWLDETIDACERSDLSSSITKRSAGLPMFVQSIISSCMSLPTFSLETFMKRLLDIAKKPVTQTGNIETDLPQVQAMNILRGIYRDSSVGAEVLMFAEEGLMLAVDGFSSPFWSIRNAAQILLGALVPRMLGQRVTQADKSHHNSVSAIQFFSMYPTLEGFFASHLGMAIDNKNRIRTLPALVPILTLLSKLRPCENTRLFSVFSPLLDKLLSSCVVTVRNLAASSSIALMSHGIDVIISFSNDIITRIASTSCANYRHGLLLVLKKLTSLADDDPELLRVLLTKGIWPHLDELVNVNRAECTEYYTRSTVFEIVSIVISYLDILPRDRSILYQDELLNLIKQHVHDQVTQNQNNDVDQQVGYFLYLKRLAKAVLDLIICIQTSDTGKAGDLLDCILSSRLGQLETEFIEEVIACLENAGYFHKTLKSQVSAALVKRLLSVNSNGNNDLTIYLNCWNALGLSAVELDVDDDIIPRLIGISGDVLYDVTVSHRTLAACLPFIGGMIAARCHRAVSESSTVCDEQFTRVLSAWSERILECSAAGEREILRNSALLAIKGSIEAVMLLYKASNIGCSSNLNTDMETVFARLVLSSLHLIRDEDECIRNEASVIATILNPAFLANADQLRSPLQSNLALTAVLDCVASQHWDSVILGQELLNILADMCSNCSDGVVSNTETQRSLLLFEQEGPNLFAEDFLLASEIVNCLKAYFKNVSALETTNSSHDFTKAFQPALHRIVKANMVQLKAVFESIEAEAPYYAFQSNSQMFVSVYICVALAGIPFVHGRLMEQSDKEVLIRSLDRLEKMNVCNWILQEEIKRAPVTVKSNFSTQ